MLFRRISRSDPEKIFVVAQNSWSTASLTNGQAVDWDYTTDQDGVGVTKAAARTASLAGLSGAGIVAETIAADAYGLIQVYGYHSAVRVRANTTGNTVVAGAALVFSPTAAAFCLEPLFTATATSTIVFAFPLAFALGTYSSWTTTTIAAFVKAMG